MFSLLQNQQLPPLLGGSPDDNISNLYQGSQMPAGPGGPGAPSMPPVAQPIPSAQAPSQFGAPQASPMPVQQDHPHQNLLGRVHDSLMNSILGGASNGYEGLLSKEEIASTKPSLFGAILHGEGTAAQIQQAKLDHLVNLKQQTVGVQRQQEVLQARTAFAKQFPPPTSGSEADMATWANRAIPYFTAHGDMETVKSLMPLVEKFAETKASKGNPFQAVQAGDAVYTFNPQTGTYSRGPDRGVPAAKLAEDEQNRQLREQAIRNGHQEFEIRQAEMASRAFSNQNKSLTDISALYAPAKTAIAQARAGNPAALKSAITNYIASVDGKARLTMGTINFLKQIDPSFTGNMQSWLAQKMSGTIPPAQLDMMEKMIDAMNKAHADTYEHRRMGAVGRNPLAESYIPPTEEIFGSPSATATTAPASGADKVRNLMGKP